MENKVSIHQPCYFPYLGVFYKIYQSDTFIHLDDAQFSNGYVFNWNRIKTPQGECRIKIPLDYHFKDTLLQVRTKDELGWKDKHIKMIEMNYSKSRYFRDVMPQIKELILSSYSSLGDMNITLMDYLVEKFGISPKTYKASSFGLDTMKEDKVIELCKTVNATTYISGHGAMNYQVDEHFTSKGINLVYSDYTSVGYEQQWGDFIPNLSVLDFILNKGYDFDKVVQFIEQGV